MTQTTVIVIGAGHAGLAMSRRLSERSIGHVDPGSRSSSLMIAALCDEFGEG